MVCRSITLSLSVDSTFMFNFSEFTLLFYYYLINNGLILLNKKKKKIPLNNKFVILFADSSSHAILRQQCPGSAWKPNGIRIWPPTHEGPFRWLASPAW